MKVTISDGDETPAGALILRRRIIFNPELLQKGPQ